jgi:ankyrin repeat protein
MSNNTGDPMELFKKAFAEDDAVLFARLLERYPEMKAKINEPVAAFDAPVITRVRSREMLDVLLEAGADINAKSHWWAGGFGLLHGTEPGLATYAIERGAVVDVHAAARLGLIEKLRELISSDPATVHARGGDGQTPLHFAGTVEVAEYLLDHGADIDARDVDHESTPAQYMVRDRQEIARYLVQRGCRTDILMAAALGDVDLVRQHLDADPGCIRLSVSEEYFPKQDPRSGGAIYIWTLGQNKTAHVIAREFGHQDIFRLLMEHSPDELKLAQACELGDEALFTTLLASRPNLAQTLSDDDRRKLVNAAQNNNTEAVRLMLSVGWPVGVRGQHGGTPLHWGAFHGNAEMVEVILRYNPPLEWIDTDFHSTPLGWAIHGSEHGWYCRSGNYAATVEALLKAGAKLPEKLEGAAAVKDVLRRFGSKAR